MAGPDGPGWSRNRFVITLALSLLILLAALDLVAVVNSES
jgi:hypothetical protein